ncbi:MAG: hypothetical protein VKP62_04985 [Candidatus Sericytochromatia bacterium]|nr:hypothetical protein [Candidatus Sericytochromatia bacterium]
MIRCARVLPAVVAASTLLVGCGQSGATVSAGNLRQGVESRSQSTRLDDADLSAGAIRQQVSPDVLRREAQADGAGNLLFPTRPLPRRAAAPAPRLAAGPVLSGGLRYPDFTGALIPAANVTVHVMAKGGGLSSPREVATALTDANGRWTAVLPAELLGKAVTTSYELGNRRWTLERMRWEGPSVASLAASQDTGDRTLEASSQNGKAALIHQVWNRALAAFERESISLDGWWTRPIGTRWPADANYYSMGTVNLTDAEWWDVNGHEIGHAIFFAGFNSSSGGGQHKIDECYGADLAWSEGFASFFSGVISISRQDPDAKFEFMVPRRKPIRLENVPEDVCQGHTNEWRVSAALWDLYDTHADGQDQVALEFKQIWGSLVKTGTGGRMADVRDAFRRVALQTEPSLRPGLAAAFAQSGVPVTLQMAR